MRCGTASIKIFDETERCEATSVDPKTAHRGPSIPAAMERTWGHANLGLYAEVVAGGRVSSWRYNHRSGLTNHRQQTRAFNGLPRTKQGNRDPVIASNTKGNPEHKYINAALDRPRGN